MLLIKVQLTGLYYVCRDVWRPYVGQKGGILNTNIYKKNILIWLYFVYIYKLVNIVVVWIYIFKGGG